MNNCKHFSEPSCLLRQLADGTSKEDSTICLRCEATLAELDLDLQPLAAARENGSLVQEAGFQRVRRLARGLWGDGEDQSQAGQTADSSTGLRMRCPHCGCPAELDGVESLSHIDCTGCGEPFRLVDEESYDIDSSRRMVGHFDLIEQVGSGSFGVVWRARDTELERIVAVKIPRREHLSGREIEKFVHEARASAALNHPNIVSVHEIGRHDDSVFIVTDFVEGMTLGDYLNDQLLTPKEAARLCAAIANALHHAHENGVVHRDLKPGNVAVDRHLNPHIMDFGLALRSSTEMTITMDGKILGTPAYMSPEQAQGDSHVADRRSDVYALGVMLFEMLTGERPFRGNVRMLLHQIVHEEAPNPQRLNSAIPRDLATICLKCLEKSPERRYQSAEALRIEFQRFLDGHPIAARPTSPLERGWRWCKRNPLAATLTSLLVASLITGTGVSSWKWAESAANAKGAQIAQSRAERTAHEMQLQSAKLLLQRGQALCDSGKAQEGLNWMCASLQTLPDFPGSQPWREVVRANITGWHASIPKLQHRWENPEEVTAVAFSPTQNLLVTGGRRGMIRRFDLATGQALGATHAEEVFEVGFSVEAIEFHPSGDHFLVACGREGSENLRGTLTSVDASTGKRLRTFLRPPGRFTTTAYSRDGSTIAVGGSSSQETNSFFWLFGADAGWEGNPIDLPGRPRSMRFTNDNSALIMQSGETMVSADVASRVVKPMNLGDFAPLVTNSRYPVSWHPSGGRFAVALQDATARIWNYRDSQEHGQNREAIDNSVSLENEVHALDFHPDGTSLLASEWSGITSFVDVPTCELAPLQLRTHGETFWTPSGDALVSFSKSRVSTWEMPRRAMRAPKTAATNSDSLFTNYRTPFAPDLRTVAVGNISGVARLFDPVTCLTVGAPMQHPLTNVSAIACSPNGKWIATACYSFESIECLVRLWDSQTGKPISDWVPQTNWVTKLEFNPDGSILASCDYAARLTLWDVNSIVEGAPKTQGVLQNQDILLTLAFSPDGSKIVAGSTDSHRGSSEARLWSVESQSLIGEPMVHTGWVSFVEYSPNGTQFLSASPDGFVRLWDAETTRPIGSPIPYSPGAGVATYSHDGEYVMTGGADGIVALWRAEDATPVEGKTMNFPGAGISALAFATDDSQCIVGLRNGVCHRIDTATFTQIGPPFVCRSPVLAARFADTGNVVVLALADGIRRWSIPEPSPDTSDTSLLVARVERSTGMRFDSASQSVVEIPWDEWLQRYTATDQGEHGETSLDERLADAVEDQDDYAARYYIGRLLDGEEHTSDWQRWQLLACRAMLHAAEDNFDAASRDYQLAHESLDHQKHISGIKPANELSDWYRHVSIRAIASERWSLAKWYLDRLISDDSDDWTLYRDRALVLGHLPEPEHRLQNVNHALNLDPDTRFLLSVADERAREGDWAMAVELFDRANQDGFLSLDAMIHHVVAALMLDAERTTALVTKMLDHTESSPLTLGIARQVVAHASYGRVDESDVARVLALSEMVVNSFPDAERLKRGQAVLSHALLLMRVGRHEEAIQSAEQAAELMQDRGQKYLLAMALAYAHQAKLEKAQSYADKLQPGVYRAEQSDFWTQQTWDCMLRELEQLGLELPP